MPTSYIIKEISRVTGHRVQDDRATLLALANRAAKEIYDTQDLPGSLAEVVLRVLPDYQISLPSFVGPLRAMRQYTTTQKVQLTDMRPRYSYQGWSTKWDRWRVKATSPIYTDLQGAGPIRITTPVIETIAPVVTIVGATDNSNKIVDTITISALDNSGVQNFNSIRSIEKSKYCDYNLTLYDSADNEIAILNNDQLTSKYTIVDVSAYPSWANNAAGELYMEVLYKQVPLILNDDSDEFICDGYDDAIVYKALEFWFGDQKDGLQTALGYFNKSAQVVKSVSGNIEGPIQLEMTFAPNPLLGLTPKRLWPNTRPWLLR